MEDYFLDVKWSMMFVNGLAHNIFESNIIDFFTVNNIKPKIKINAGWYKLPFSKNVRNHKLDMRQVRITCYKKIYVKLKLLL